MKRMENAKSMALDVEKTVSGYSLTGSGGKIYQMTVVGVDITCTCADAQDNMYPCKHAFLMLRSEGRDFTSLPAGYKDNAWFTLDDLHTRGLRYLVTGGGDQSHPPKEPITTPSRPLSTPAPIIPTLLATSTALLPPNTLHTTPMLSSPPPPPPLMSSKENCNKERDLLILSVREVLQQISTMTLLDVTGPTLKSVLRSLTVVKEELRSQLPSKDSLPLERIDQRSTAPKGSSKVRRQPSSKHLRKKGQLTRKAVHIIQTSVKGRKQQKKVAQLGTLLMPLTEQLCEIIAPLSQVLPPQIPAPTPELLKSDYW